jgi:hypothetical protein
MNGTAWRNRNPNRARPVGIEWRDGGSAWGMPLETEEGVSR